jgi:hypothetical protein
MQSNHAGIEAQADELAMNFGTGTASAKKS